MIGRSLFLLSFLLSSCGPAAAEPEVTPMRDPDFSLLQEMQAAIHGRAVRQLNGIVRQWPGSYFETSFAGRGAVFRVGEGDAILHVIVDGQLIRTLVKPAAGAYRIDGLTSDRHTLRIEVANESQEAPTVFGGFYGAASVRQLPTPRRPRQIEFIGDSYTVGYGNTSSKRECSEAEVWATTDTSQAFGPILAKRYRADYQVNAISGRGIVRNYGGFEANTLPAAYSFALLDHGAMYRDPAWHPQLIVISLGTNDFSTPLKAGEKWPTRGELRLDYESTYVRFIQQVRAQNPRALFILWATDTADGEVAAETRSVVGKLRALGERRVSFVLVPGLSFSGCNYHPSLADDRVIAQRLGEAIEAQAPFGR